jgi:hypothetical protein
MIIRTLIYLAVAALAVFNGVISTTTFTVFALQGIWYHAVLPSNLTSMFILSGTISTLLYAIAGGIPAALLETAMPRYKKSTLTACIWLATMIILSAPTLMKLFPPEAAL